MWILLSNEKEQSTDTHNNVTVSLNLVISESSQTHLYKSLEKVNLVSYDRKETYQWLSRPEEDWGISEVGV